MAESQTSAPPRNSLKRKRVAPLDGLTPAEKEAWIGALEAEIDGLLRFYREVMGQKLGLPEMGGGCDTIQGQIASLMEESDSPLSALVEQIHALLKDKNEGVTAASVKSGILSVGQRVMYGVPNPDADVLEDDSASALWCWETRELKLLPKATHGAIKVRRKCRKKICERITAVAETLYALRKSDHDQDYKTDLAKASEKLAKAMAEAGIQALVDSLMQRTAANMAEKETRRDEKEAMKQLEKSKKKAEKEQKKMERELQKEKLKAEKESKRLREEAEKEEKRREREENELSKQLKKQQEAAEKDQRRREKEAAVLKRRLAMQKQASLMEHFLKKAKTNASSPDQLSIGINKCDKKNESIVPGAVTCLMDSALSTDQEVNSEEIFKSHLSSWRRLGSHIRSNKKQHWGLRRKPKMELIKEIKLSATTTDRGLVQYEEDNFENLVDGCRERVSSEDLISTTESSHSDERKYKGRMQLLQFDKSHRPAFYGIWPRNCNIIWPRNPFRKNPELDYEVDSDEEWEEEEPGESLSDLEKDEDESLEDGCSKADEEDESEDGFFVPDGYLSENEGVQVDRMETDSPEIRNESCQQVESQDFSELLRQHKYLQSVTEHALRKNQPLIISNLRHEKSGQTNPEELTGSAKLEIMCLQALCIRLFPGEIAPDVSISNHIDEEDSPQSYRKSKTPPINLTPVSDSDLPIIVSVIRSCSQGINKVVDSLQQKFPDIPRTHLRMKVREISDFADNRWQVKKDVLEKLGMSISPERSERTKSIAAFFSKRCLPPAKGLKPDYTAS